MGRAAQKVAQLLADLCGPPNQQKRHIRPRTIDAADYTVWCDSLGSTTNLAADGDGDDAITQANYIVWKSNVGNPSGAGVGAAAAVPEPATSVLLMFAVAGASGAAEPYKKFHQLIKA